MATGQFSGVLKYLRGIEFLRDVDMPSDADLLGRYINHNEGAAFEGLLRRHGPMVFGVCRRVLVNTHDAEDAFQAAFLVLARKAAAVWPREMVGNWLYGVAYRTALKAKSMIAKRQAREKQVLEMPEVAARTEAAWSDIGPLLDHELNRLADKHRVPVVLCDFEGKSQRDVAKQLGWPAGTLTTRLVRARQILARRLSRRGVVLSAAALANLLAQDVATASLPVSLIVSTSKAAAFVAAGNGATAVSAEVAALTEGVLQTMFIAKCKSAALVALVLAVLGSGAGLCAHWNLDDRSAAAEQTSPEFAENSEFTAFVAQERGGRDGRGDPANHSGKIVGVAKDGKSITVETPSTNRGEDAVKQEIKLNDKTELKFFGVGPDGAKLVEGLSAQIWTTGDAKDIAAKIYAGGVRRDMAADFSGKLTSVSKDGAVLTFESIRRSEDAKTAEVKLTISTVVNYSGISKGGAKPTVGYGADVWFERGSKTDAAAVHFRGGEIPGREREREREARTSVISNRVVTISKDGKSITMEVPPQERGGESTRIDVKIDDKTRVTYVNVGPGGDQPTEGYGAAVLLAEGSKDTAAAITFLAPQKDRLHTLRGQVLGVGKDGKSFTIEVPPAERGLAAERLTVKITEHTRVIYNGVALNGARLTEGYTAMVALDEGSKDAAFQVVFGPAPEGDRR